LSGARADKQDDGDHGPHPPSDEQPEGLGPDMAKYLRRGMPEKNKTMYEVEAGEALKVETLPIPPNKL